MTNSESVELYAQYLAEVAILWPDPGDHSPGARKSLSTIRARLQSLDKLSGKLRRLGADFDEAAPYQIREQLAQYENGPAGHASNCDCFICNPGNRGALFAARLSDSEPTVRYDLKVPQSLKDRARAAGAEAVRKILDENLPK